jgi:hypothetical protein
VFANLVSLFKSAIRLVVDGVKDLLGLAQEDDSEAALVTSKVASAGLGLVALMALFVPGLRPWADHLFRVAYQLWSSQPVIPGRTA